MNYPPACPCGSGRSYSECCGPLHVGGAAADAPTLMRSRYSAYVLGLGQYLLDTWHPDTRPGQLDLDAGGTKWLGLEIRQYCQRDADHAEVEFVARFRVGGRGHRLHETSRFLLMAGRWIYIDGDLHE